MEKKIYKYFNGFEDVFADPAEVDYRMSKASENLDMEVIGQWLTLPTDESGEVLDDSRLSPGVKANFTEACHRLLPSIRAGFEIKEFDKSTGQGMTMDELLGLYADYMEWRAGLKKNTEPSPIVAMPTASTATSWAAKSLRTKPSTGSTSTSDAARRSSEPSSTGPTST